MPGTGLGILRDDPDLAAVGKLPHARSPSMAREHTLLVLAKANSRATVHRPAYLDYVGVKTFDDERRGHRRAPLPRPVLQRGLHRVGVARPAAAREGHGRAQAGRPRPAQPRRQGPDRHPRDLPARRAVPHARRRAGADGEPGAWRPAGAASCGSSYAATPTAATSACLVFLPRDRYNTTVRERFSEILKESFAGESIEFTVRMSESTTARVHFVVHPAKGEKIPDVDVSDLERRLTDASRSWRDDFTAATIAEFGEDVGSRLARSFEASFPEAYKEDFSAATGALDLGRLEALGDVRAPTCRCSPPLDAARGEARLKVFRRGAPISLSEVLPALSSMGVEVVDERPYELDHTDHPSYIYEFGLRYAPGHARPGARAVPGHDPGGLGRLQRDRRLQRARARAPG